MRMNSKSIESIEHKIKESSTLTASEKRFVIDVLERYGKLMIYYTGDAGNVRREIEKNDT